MKIFHFFYKILKTAWHFVQNLFGISTLGVRAIVLDKENQVLLVKHTYSPGWYLPGGGIKKGESVYDAITRELKEETGIVVKKIPRLYSVYLHYYAGMHNYPILFIVREYDQEESSSMEIAEINWFDYSALPNDITPATKRRLDEYFKDQLPSPKW